MDQPRFQDVPPSRVMAQEELSLLQNWFRNLEALQAERETHLARLGYLTGFVAALDQTALQAELAALEEASDATDQDGQLDGVHEPGS